MHGAAHTSAHARSHMRAQATGPGRNFRSARNARAHDFRTLGCPSECLCSATGVAGTRSTHHPPPTPLHPSRPIPAVLDTAPRRVPHLRRTTPHQLLHCTTITHHISQAHDDGRMPAARHHMAPPCPTHRTNVYSTPCVTRSVAVFVCM